MDAPQSVVSKPIIANLDPGVQQVVGACKKRNFTANDIGQLADEWVQQVDTGSKPHVIQLVPAAMLVAETGEQSGAEKQKLATQILDTYLERTKNDSRLPPIILSSIFEALVERAIAHAKHAHSPLLEEEADPQVPIDLDAWITLQAEILQNETISGLSGKILIERVERMTHRYSSLWTLKGI